MKKALHFFDQYFEKVFMNVFFCIMLACVFLQVFTRLILNDPLSFTEEVSRFAYVWITFLGISFSMRNRDHIRIEAFTKRLKPQIKMVLEILIDFLTICIMGYLFIESIQFVSFTAINKAPALNVSMMIVNICLPIGTCLSVVRGVQIIIEDIKKLIQNSTEEAQLNKQEKKI